MLDDLKQDLVRINYYRLLHSKQVELGRIVFEVLRMQAAYSIMWEVVAVPRKLTTTRTISVFILGNAGRDRKLMLRKDL